MRIGPGMSYAPAGIALNLSTLRTGTQAELAAALGVHTLTISKWERGESAPSISRLCQLAEALGCTPNDLLRAPGDRLVDVLA